MITREITSNITRDTTSDILGGSGIGLVWILATGFWNDNGVWNDNANWID